MLRRARMWKYDALHISETCLSKDIWESRWTPKLFIDDWSFIGEPATDMDCIDLASVARGLDLGLKKAMASDFDGFRWRPFCKSQLFTLMVQDSSEAIWVTSVDEFEPMWSWVSSAYWWKETVVFLFDNSEVGWMTLAIGDINRTNKSGPKTEPCGTPVGDYYYKYLHALNQSPRACSNCRLVPYWREFLGVSWSRTWSDTPFCKHIG